MESTKNIFFKIYKSYTQKYILKTDNSKQKKLNIFKLQFTEKETNDQ